MRTVKNIALKIITALNGISLLFWICALDGIDTWQPYVIMLCNILWIFLIVMANRRNYED